MQEERNHKTRALWLTGVLHAFTHLCQVTLMPLYRLIRKREAIKPGTVNPDSIALST
jgi:hypothetical protein